MLVLLWAAQASLAPAEEAPERRVQAAALLNQSRWEIELRRMFTPEPAEPVRDTLQFIGGQVTSERLAPSGYKPGLFTLSIGPNGGPVWEATQLSEQDGIVLWRGELDRDVIRGTVSRLPIEGSTEDFRFEGKEILASRPQPEQPAPAEPASAVSEPAAETAPPETPAEPASSPSESTTSSSEPDSSSPDSPTSGALP